MTNIFSIDSRAIVHGPVNIPAEVPKDWLDLAMKITMGFEGTSWNTVTGNFDGMGISVGALQWNYGQGSLQTKILQPYINRFGIQKLDSHFSFKVSESAYMGPKEAVVWAKKNIINMDDNQQRKRIKEWKAFLFRQSVIEIQKEAAHSIASKAFNDAIENDLLTARSFCWFFDVYVQNGSLKGVMKPELSVAEKVKTILSGITGQRPSRDVVAPLEPDLSLYEKNLVIEGGVNRELWSMNPPSEECQILFNWICSRAARNRWRSDVITRKGTIAHGVGWVHGQYYDLNTIAMEGITA